MFINAESSGRKLETLPANRPMVRSVGFAKSKLPRAPAAYRPEILNSTPLFASLTLQASDAPKGFN